MDHEDMEHMGMDGCLFCCFTSQVNSYGHGGKVSPPNHTFSWASLNKQLTRTLCTYFPLQLTTTLLEWFSWREESDLRNYFMINLHESMGLGRHGTRDPWIGSKTLICCQTRYRLRYTAQYGWMEALMKQSVKISLSGFQGGVGGLYYLVPSADKVCKQFGPRTGLTKRSVLI